MHFEKNIDLRQHMMIEYSPLMAVLARNYSERAKQPRGARHVNGKPRGKGTISLLHGQQVSTFSHDTTAAQLVKRQQLETWRPLTQTPRDSPVVGTLTRSAAAKSGNWHFTLVTSDTNFTKSITHKAHDQDIASKYSRRRSVVVQHILPSRPRLCEAICIPLYRHSSAGWVSRQQCVDQSLAPPGLWKRKTLVRIQVPSSSFC